MWNLVTISLDRKRINLRCAFGTCAETVKKTCPTARHSRPQRPRSFWSALKITTSGQVQLRSPRFTDFPLLCACSESSVTNLIGSGLNLLCLQSHSNPECRWTWPEVVIFSADQKDRGLWGREWTARENRHV